jgi:hypothetical protein
VPYHKVLVSASSNLPETPDLFAIRILDLAAQEESRQLFEAHFNHPIADVKDVLTKISSSAFNGRKRRNVQGKSLHVDRRDCKQTSILLVFTSL